MTDTPPVDFESTVHSCPPDTAEGPGLTPCCGKTLLELPRQDRVAHPVAEARGLITVTCTGSG